MNVGTAPQYETRAKTEGEGKEEMSVSMREREKPERKERKVM